MKEKKKNIKEQSEQRASCLSTLCVRPGQDSHIVHRPIFTKFGTLLLCTMQKNMFLISSIGSSIHAKINPLPLTTADRVLWRGLIHGATHHSGACY